MSTDSAINTVDTQANISRPDNNYSQNDDAVKQRLASKLAGVPEHAFLAPFSLAACEELGLDYLLIGRMNPFSNIMRSVCMAADGEIVENISYSLDGTPCARVMESDSCVYSDNVSSLFPHDMLLVDMQVRGYIGVPLSDSSGQTFGIMIGLTRRPIPCEKDTLAVFEFFKERVAASVERSEKLERYEFAVAEASDGIWDWDIVTGGTTISSRIQEILGYDIGEGPHDLSKIENRIHPDDLSAHVEGISNHINFGAPYDIKLRLINPGGEYHWFRSRGKARLDANGRPICMIGSFSKIHEFLSQEV